MHGGLHDADTKPGAHSMRVLGAGLGFLMILASGAILLLWACR
jgi:hypothetical protein